MDGGAAGDISNITIDTSVAGDRIITYSATDAAGNTGTATRTVHVVMPEAAPAPELAPEPTPEPVPAP